MPVREWLKSAADSIGIWKEEQKRNNHKTGATKVLKPIGKFLR